MRIRTIKPDFFRHEELYQAEQDTGYPLRLTFAGLWCAADRAGRFRWRLNLLKLDILPFDTIDFSDVLEELAARGFIIKYRNGFDLYGFIPTFCKHQVINNRERASEFPGVDDANSEVLTRGARDDDASGTRPPRVRHASTTREESTDNDIKSSGSESTTSTRGARVGHARGTRLVQDQGEGNGREDKVERESLDNKGSINESDNTIQDAREKKNEPLEDVEKIESVKENKNSQKKSPPLSDDVDRSYNPNIGADGKFKIDPPRKFRPKQFTSGLVYPWSGQKFHDQWEHWKDYLWDWVGPGSEETFGNGKNYTYRGMHAEQAALQLLSELSGGVEDEAYKILKHTMGNNWKGFVKPKIEKSNSNGKFSNGKSKAENDAEHARSIADRLSSLNRQG